MCGGKNQWKKGWFGISRCGLARWTKFVTSFDPYQYHTWMWLEKCILAEELSLKKNFAFLALSWTKSGTPKICQIGQKQLMSWSRAHVWTWMWSCGSITITLATLSHWVTTGWLEAKVKPFLELLFAKKNFKWGLNGTFCAQAYQTFPSQKWPSITSIDVVRDCVWHKNSPQRTHIGWDSPFSDFWGGSCSNLESPRNFKEKKRTQVVNQNQTTMHFLVAMEIETISRGYSHQHLQPGGSSAHEELGKTFKLAIVSIFLWDFKWQWMAQKWPFVLVSRHEPV